MIPRNASTVNDLRSIVDVQEMLTSGICKMAVCGTHLGLLTGGGLEFFIMLH